MAFENKKNKTSECSVYKETFLDYISKPESCTPATSILWKRGGIQANKKNPGYCVQSHQSTSDTFLVKQGLNFAFSRFANLVVVTAFAHLFWCQAPLCGWLWLVSWLLRHRPPSSWHGVCYFQNYKADRLVMRCSWAMYS